MNLNFKNQPWLGKPVTDVVFILLPPFISLLVIFLFPQCFRNNKNMPDSWWVLLILLVDVAHVYSTLYRTYFNRELYQKKRPMMIAIPVFAFVAAVLLYSVSFVIFWRVLAYLAVFHFVRQQYGFMRLYSRRESAPLWMKRIDTCTIYYATLYPLIYWHLSGPRNFNWFIEGDFLTASSSVLLVIATVLYLAVLGVYIGKEAYVWIKIRSVNLPKVAVVVGTLVSWYFGIVYFNGDMAFTILNVVSHGIPYMALIWIFGKKQISAPHNTERKWSVFVSRYGLWVFLSVIFLLAYIEEGLWDSALWREHRNVFSVFYSREIKWDSTLLNFLVPLLALPQITHYIIDGFIWKIKKETSCK